MKKVLIVDSDKPVVEILSFILRREGYTVDSWYHGVDLIDVVVSMNPSVILLDMKLNGLDGRQVCEELKRSECTSHIPVLLFSTSHTLRNSVKRQYRADDFLPKPIDVNILISKVRSLVC